MGIIWHPDDNISTKVQPSKTKLYLKANDDNETNQGEVSLANESRYSNTEDNFQAKNSES